MPTFSVSSAFSCSFEVARSIGESSYGLVFGFNTFLALLFRTALTLAVADDALGTAFPPLGFPAAMTYLPSAAAAAPNGSGGSQAVSPGGGGHGHQMMQHLLHNSAGHPVGVTNGTGTSTSVVHHMKPRSDRIEVRTYHLNSP